MSDYQKVNCLKLKSGGGIKKKKKKSKKSKRSKKPKLTEEEKKKKEAEEKDVTSHGGWWPITTVEQLSGLVAVEMGKRAYMHAVDNGRMKVGEQRAKGDVPNLPEQLTGVVVGERKVALKTGFGKYLSVDKSGLVVGRSDAISSMEQWELVFEGGRTALLAPNDKFVSCNEDGEVVATDDQAQLLVKVRSGVERVVKTERDLLPEEEKTDTVGECEKNYVRKYQAWQDGKLRISKKDVKELEKAKEEGRLHNALLDRRSKMKSDRYCM